MWARILGLLAACAAAAAVAQTTDVPIERLPAPKAPPPAEGAPPGEPAPAPERRSVEGAIGPMFSISPEYQGARRAAIKVTPGIFIRWAATPRPTPVAS